MTANRNLIWIILVVFVVIRIFRLDMDVPFSRMFMISPVDESYYVPGAFTIVEEGSYISKSNPLADHDASTLLLSNSVNTAMTLFIAGNNYYGLRLSSVIMSLVVVLLFIACMRLIPVDPLNNGNTRSTWIVMALALLATDATFLLFSRVQDPVMMRAAWMMLVIFMMYRWWSQGEKRPFLFTAGVGCIAVLSVLIGYVHNAFICAAAGSTLFLVSALNRNYRRALMDSFGFIVGAVVGLSLFAGLNFWLTDISLSEMTSFLNEASEGRMQADRMSFIGQLKNSVVHTLSTSFFRLNPGVLLLFMVSFPAVIMSAWKEKKGYDILLVMLVGWLFLQAIFENTYPEKRHTIMLPVVLLLVVRGLPLFFQRASAGTKTSWLTLAIAILLVAYIERGYLTQVIPSYPGARIFAYVGIICALILTVTISLRLTGKLKLAENRWPYLLGIVIVPGILFWFNTVVVNPQYTYRDGMIKLGEKIGKGHVYGGIGMGLRLYSEGKYSINHYAWFHHEDEYSVKLNQLFDAQTEDAFIILYPKHTNRMGTIEYLNELHADFDTVLTYDFNDRSVVLLKKRQ